MTTKECPKCGSHALARFSSLNKKYCTECYAWLPWELSERQKPLVGSSKDRKEN